MKQRLVLLILDLLILDLLHKLTGFVGQKLDFFLYSEKLIKSIYVFLLKLRGFLVESEARSIDFFDFLGTEPTGWTSSTCQLHKWPVGGWSEE